MVAKNIFSPSDYENVDINSWANESFELAKSSVYSGKLNFSHNK